MASALEELAGHLSATSDAPAPESAVPAPSKPSSALDQLQTYLGGGQQQQPQKAGGSALGSLRDYLGIKDPAASEEQSKASKKAILEHAKSLYPEAVKRQSGEDYDIRVMPIDVLGFKGIPVGHHLNVGGPTDPETYSNLVDDPKVTPEDFQNKVANGLKTAKEMMESAETPESQAIRTLNKTGQQASMILQTAPAMAAHPFWTGVGLTGYGVTTGALRGAAAPEGTVLQGIKSGVAGIPGMATFGAINPEGLQKESEQTPSVEESLLKRGYNPTVAALGELGTQAAGMFGPGLAIHAVTQPTLEQRITAEGDRQAGRSPLQPTPEYKVPLSTLEDFNRQTRKEIARLGYEPHLQNMTPEQVMAAIESGKKAPVMPETAPMRTAEAKPTEPAPPLVKPEAADPVERATGLTRKEFTTQLYRATPHIPEEQRAAEVNLIDRAGKRWAKANDRPLEEFYQRLTNKVQRAEGVPELEAAAQTQKGEVRGAFDPVKRIMSFWRGSNFSTVMHETLHGMRTGGLILEEDLAKFEKAYGIQDGVWKDAHDERFAKDFERWLATGEAPHPELAPLFQKIADWMKAIYKDVKNNTILNANLDKNVKQGFEQMFGETARKAKALKPEPGGVIKPPAMPMDQLPEMTQPTPIPEAPRPTTAPPQAFAMPPETHPNLLPATGMANAQVEAGARALIARGGWEAKDLISKPHNWNPTDIEKGVIGLRLAEARIAWERIAARERIQGSNSAIVDARLKAVSELTAMQDLFDRSGSIGGQGLQSMKVAKKLAETRSSGGKLFQAGEEGSPLFQTSEDRAKEVAAKAEAATILRLKGEPAPTHLGFPEKGINKGEATFNGLDILSQGERRFGPWSDAMKKLYPTIDAPSLKDLYKRASKEFDAGRVLARAAAKAEMHDYNLMEEMTQELGHTPTADDILNKYNRLTVGKIADGAVNAAVTVPLQNFVLYTKKAYTNGLMQILRGSRDEMEALVGAGRRTIKPEGEAPLPSGAGVAYGKGVAKGYEVPAKVKWAWDAVSSTEGMKKAWRSTLDRWDEVSRQRSTEAGLYGAEGQPFEIKGYEGPMALGFKRFMNASSLALETIFDTQKEGSKNGYLYRKAYDLVKQGKAPAEVANHIDAFVEQMKRENPGLDAEAEAAAQKELMRGELGPVAKDLQRLGFGEGKNIPHKVFKAGARMLVKYHRIPVNFGKWVYNHSPARLVAETGQFTMSRELTQKALSKLGVDMKPETREALTQRYTGRSADAIVVDVAMASAATGIITYWAMNGRLIGKLAKPGTNERKIQDQQHMEPYSFKVGDQWVPLHGFGHMVDAVTTTIDGVMETKESGNPVKGLAENLLAIGRNTPYIQAIKEINDAMDVENPRAGQAAANVIAGSYIPPWVNQIAQSMDQYKRQTPTAMSSFQSRIPGLRESLPPRLNAQGERIPMSGLGALGLPYMTKEVHPVVQQLADQGVSLPGVPTSIRGPDGKMQKIDSNVVSKISNDRMAELLPKVIRLMSGPQWQRLNTAQKQHIVNLMAGKMKNTIPEWQQLRMENRRQPMQATNP